MSGQFLYSIAIQVNKELVDKDDRIAELQRDNLQLDLKASRFEEAGLHTLTTLARVEKERDEANARIAELESYKKTLDDMLTERGRKIRELERTIAQNAESTSGVAMIAKERNRQITEEKFYGFQDDRYTSGELADAGLSYLKAACKQARGESMAYIKGMYPAGELPWPWQESWFKPGTQIRNLTKAGALIAAEIDRLIRLESNGQPD